MKNNANLFKKYIQQRSTKEQRPFAGLSQDLKITYKTNSATGNDIMELLQQLTAGAETETLDGLKTRLVRLDKLREFLLQSELQGQEQKTVYTAYTKVQTAIRKRKDEYTKKHTILKQMLSDAGSNISQAAFQASDDIPQLRMAMVIGGGLFKYVKKIQQEKKEKLEQRNQQLKKDAELYYERELLRGKNIRTQKGKLKKSSGTYKDPFAGMENSMVHESVFADYGTAGQNSSRKKSGDKFGIETKNDRLIKQIADDVRIVANYYKGKLIRDKDERMDRLEAERERSRGILGRERDKYGNLDKDGEGSSFLDKWMPAILGPGIWAALKKIPNTLKRLPGKLKAIPALIKAAPALITSGLSKIGDFLKPDNLAALPGKGLEWVKSLPGKGMKAASDWWNKAPMAETQKVYNGAIRDPKTGRFVSRTAKVAEEAAEVAAKSAGTGAALKGASKLTAIPILGPLLAGGFDIADRRAKGQGWIRSLAGGAVTGVASGLGEAAGTVMGAPGGPVGAFAGGAAGALGGAEVGSRAFDSVLNFLGALNPFSVTEANASEFGPEEQAKKKLIKDALVTQGKIDPGNTPAAIVPIAKIGKTSDLKDILQSDSNGLGFLFSLKGVDTADLIHAMLGQGPGNIGTGPGTSAPRSSSGSSAPRGASGAASLGGAMRRDRGPAGPGPAPGQTETEQFMQAIGMAETGKDGRPLDDPSRFIRTKGGANSSAYGPYQITQDLAQRALKNTDWVDDPEVAQWMKERFIPQGKKMLKSSYSDPTYGAGGQGDLNTEYDRAMYMKMSKALMAGTLKEAGGNPLEAAADWRFGESSNAQDLAARDPRYYNEVSKSMQQQKEALAQADKNATLAQAQPTENILGQNKAPTLNDSKQSAREKAIEEWHQSSDPNKGTASEYLKKKGLVEGAGQTQSGGVEGVDYTVDPDNGEKVYFDAEYKQEMAKLSPAPAEPQMSESMKAVKERSEKVAVAQAAPVPTPGPITVNNDNRSSGGSTGDSSGNQDSGAARWRQSWEKANDIEMT